MAKPRPEFTAEDNSSAPLSPGGHLPSACCGRWGGEWTEPDENGVKWTITGPRNMDYQPGDRWTCTLCQKEQGRHSQTSNQETVAV